LLSNHTGLPIGEARHNQLRTKHLGFGGGGDPGADSPEEVPSPPELVREGDTMVWDVLVVPQRPPLAEPPPQPSRAPEKEGQLVAVGLELPGEQKARKASPDPAHQAGLVVLASKLASSILVFHCSAAGGSGSGSVVAKRERECTGSARAP